MTAVLFKCPETQKTIDIRLETDTESMAQIRREAIRVACPHCGQQHSFAMGEARLRDRLKD
jgi:predicted RNA-binding Zn-ribbon protein involved in translation (DUF1610 family)